jgi:hypothetical protein
MNSAENAKGTPSRRGGADPKADESTGLPFLRTWSAVYVFVMVSFAVYVLLLIVLEGWFS